MDNLRQEGDNLHQTHIGCVILRPGQVSVSQTGFCLILIYSSISQVSVKYHITYQTSIRQVSGKYQASIRYQAGIVIRVWYTHHSPTPPALPHHSITAVPPSLPLDFTTHLPHRQSRLMMIPSASSSSRASAGHVLWLRRRFLPACASGYS